MWTYTGYWHFIDFLLNSTMGELVGSIVFTSWSRPGGGPGLSFLLLFTSPVLLEPLHELLFVDNPEFLGKYDAWKILPAPQRCSSPPGDAQHFGNITDTQKTHFHAHSFASFFVFSSLHGKRFWERNVRIFLSI